MTARRLTPNEYSTFWERMKQAAKGQSRPEILSDHPSDDRRMEQMKQWVPYALAAKKAYVEGKIAPD